MVSLSDVSKISNQEIINKYNKFLIFNENLLKEYNEKVEAFPYKRNPVFIIMRILDAIPQYYYTSASSDGSVGNEYALIHQLTTDLDKYIHESVFCDPNCWTTIFQKVAVSLDRYIPNKDETWIIKITAIFNDTIVE